MNGYSVFPALFSCLFGAPEAFEARETCLTDVYEQSVTTENFSIQWPPEIPLDPQVVAEFGEVLEESLRIQTEDLGWRPPPGIDAWEMTILLEDLGGYGGYTWYGPCDGGWIPYIVFDDNAASGGPEEGFQEQLVAHELFHAIQMAYGFQEFFFDFENAPNKWWVEASAQYQQGVVWDGDALWSQVASVAWSTQPWKSIQTHDQTGFQYGSFVFPLSIEGELDDVGWHRAFWEHLDARAGYHLPDELDDFLRARDSSLIEQWGRFLQTASEGDFPRYEFLLGVRDLALFASLPNATAAEYGALDLPVEGSVPPETAESPEYLGANFVFFGTTQAESNRRLVVHFDGDPEGPDGTPIEWTVELAAVRSGEVLARHSAVPELVDGRWTVHVRADGIEDTIEGVYLIASPITPFEGAAGWGWAAELRRGTTDELAFSDATAGRGCTEGCQSTRITQGAWLLPLMIVLRRRPHSL